MSSGPLGVTRWSPSVTTSLTTTTPGDSIPRSATAVRSNLSVNGEWLHDSTNVSTKTDQDQRIQGFKDSRIRGFGIRGFGIRGFGIRGFGIRGFGIRGFGI